MNEVRLLAWLRGEDKACKDFHHGTVKLGLGFVNIQLGL